MNAKAVWMRALLSLSLMTSAGCYTQRPLDGPVPAPATRIIAELTDAGTVAMSNLIGPGATEVEGVVAAANDEAWTLQLLRVDHRDRRSIDWNREAVRFPRTALHDPVVKVLDRKKSWLAAGAITIGALLAARSFNLLGGDSDETTEPIPEFLLIPGRGR